MVGWSHFTSHGIAVRWGKNKETDSVLILRSRLRLLSSCSHIPHLIFLLTMQNFTKFLDDESTAFSYLLQSPQQVEGSSSSPNTSFFSYTSPVVYKGLGLTPTMRTFPYLRSSSPMTSPIVNVAARKGKGKRPAAEEWLEGLQLPKRHQAVDLREGEASPSPSVEVRPPFLPEVANC
jgi:hypothetical protein